MERKNNKQPVTKTGNSVTRLCSRRKHFRAITGAHQKRLPVWDELARQTVQSGLPRGKPPVRSTESQWCARSRCMLEVGVCSKAGKKMTEEFASLCGPHCYMRRAGPIGPICLVPICCTALCQPRWTGGCTDELTVLDRTVWNKQPDTNHSAQVAFCESSCNSQVVTSKL